MRGETLRNEKRKEKKKKKRFGLVYRPYLVSQAHHNLLRLNLNLNLSVASAVVSDICALCSLNYSVIINKQMRVRFERDRKWWRKKIVGQWVWLLSQIQAIKWCACPSSCFNLSQFWFWFWFQPEPELGHQLTAPPLPADNSFHISGFSSLVGFSSVCTVRLLSHSRLAWLSFNSPISFWSRSVLL